MESKLKIRTHRQQEDEGDEPVSPTGQYLNSKSLALCIIAVLESEIPIDDSCSMDLLENVFLPINPRFSSIMVSDGRGMKYWKRVEVNLQDHIVVPEPPEGLSMEERDDHFSKYLTKIGMEPFPQDRPLWEVHITKYPTSKAAGHLVFKLHHALGDGYSLMGALLSCLQRADNPSLPLTFPSLRPTAKVKTSATDVIGCVSRTLSPIYNTIHDFVWSFLKSSFMPDPKTPIRSGDDANELQRIKLCPIALSLDQIATVKKKLRVTVNDVVTGTVFLGVRLYMLETQKGCGRSSATALVVMNTRNIGGYKSVQEMLHPETKSIWGNQYAFLHVKVPKLVNEQSLNPLDFIAQAQKVIKRKKNSMAVYLNGQSLEMIRKFRGAEVAAHFIHDTFKNSSMTITNLIGPVDKMALANHPCKGLYFMVVGAPQSLGINIVSYMRTLRIGVAGQEGFIDSQKLGSCIETAFELIYNAAQESI